jgi:glycosyltransferase involved in cell wall biosynthesis
MQPRAALLEARPALALSERPLRIALLGYRSNPYSGGQGVYLKYLSKALVEQGHQVDVISGEPYPQLDRRVRLIPLPGLNLFAAPNHVTALRPHHFRSATDLIEYFSMLTGGFPEPYTFGRRLVRHFRVHRPQYDVVHDNQSLCYGLLSLEQLGYPIVATIHHPITMDRDIALANARDAGTRALIRRWHSFLRMQTRVARRLRHVVTVSNASAHDIAAAFGLDQTAIQVVPNGIDLDDFGPLPEVGREPFHLVSTASADAPLKGTQHLLRALALLARDYPELKLTIVGHLKPGGSTAQLIEALALGNRVTCRSALGTPDIRALYATATIAVVPSEYEGFGLPAGEAMACAVPVVATTGGALPEVVADAGVTVPVRDPAALANAIRRLLQSPAERERLGRRGRQRIVEQFNWQRAAQRLSAIYNGAIDESRDR